MVGANSTLIEDNISESNAARRIRVNGQSDTFGTRNVPCIN